MAPIIFTQFFAITPTTGVKILLQLTTDSPIVSGRSVVQKRTTTGYKIIDQLGGGMAQPTYGRLNLAVITRPK